MKESRWNETVHDTTNRNRGSIVGFEVSDCNYETVARPQIESLPART